MVKTHPKVLLSVTVHSMPENLDVKIWLSIGMRYCKSNGQAEIVASKWYGLATKAVCDVSLPQDEVTNQLVGPPDNEKIYGLIVGGSDFALSSSSSKHKSGLNLGFHLR